MQQEYCQPTILPSPHFRWVVNKTCSEMQSESDPKKNFMKEIETLHKESNVTEITGNSKDSLVTQKVSFYVLRLRNFLSHESKPSPVYLDHRKSKLGGTINPCHFRWEFLPTVYPANKHKPCLSPGSVFFGGRLKIRRKTNKECHETRDIIS